MRNAIVDKLKQHMKHPPKTEADVVYALVQVRKLLEHDRARSKHNTLTFFCDWALHPELSHSEGGKKLLKILDNRLGRYNPKDPASIDPDGKVSEMISLDLFNRQLNGFCKTMSLPTNWTDDWGCWQKCVLLYGEIVRDVPVVITKKDYPFKYIRRLELSNLEPSKAIVEANPRDKYFGLNWKFTLSDGNTFNMPYTSNLLEA